MSAHYWLFPWLSLFVSLAAVAGGFFLGRKPAVADNFARLNASYFVVWLIATALLVLGALEVGNWGATDYIPARGIIAGAFVGPLLAFFLRRPLNKSTLTTIVIGTSTALVAGCRLWLTHGEVSGLVCFALSAGLSIFCLVFAPNYFDKDSQAHTASVLTLSYIVVVVSAVLLGFTRAGALGDLYWADIPLIIGSAYAAGLLTATALERFGYPGRSIAVITVVAAVVTPLSLAVAHSLPIIGLTALGAFIVAVPLLLIPRSSNPDNAVLLGNLLIVAGVTLSFTLLSGYGIALLALGMMTVAVITATGDARIPTGWLMLVSLLLLYRLEVLQSGTSVRAIGLSDLWDLLAIGLGMLLPRLVITYLVQRVAGSLRWPSVAQWIITLAVPTLMLDYIWQPRSLTGLFLGLATSQILADSSRDDCDAVALTSVMCALLLLVFLPGLDILGAPSRTVRIISVLTITGLIIFRILISSKKTAVKAV